MRTMWKTQATAKTNMLAVEDAKLGKLRVIGTIVSRLHFEKCNFCKAHMLNDGAIGFGNSLASLWLRGVPTPTARFTELCHKQITGRKSDLHSTSVNPFSNIKRVVQCISPHYGNTFLPCLARLGAANER